MTGQWLKTATSMTLVAALVMSSLAACGGNSETVEVSSTTGSVETTTTAPTTTTTIAPPTTSPPPTAGEPTWDLVLMGDSVLLQSRIALQQRLERDLGVQLTLHNWINPDVTDFSAGGERSADLLERLRTDEELRQDLAEAEVIIFDVPMGILNDTCGSPDLPQAEAETCWAEIPSVYEADVDAIFEEVVSLRNPTDAMIRVTDVWQFRWPTLHSQGLYDIVRPAWQTMNQGVADAATRHDIPLVEAYAAFTGTDGERDPVAAGDVQSDEFHLTPQGSDVFVDLISSLGYAPLE